MKKLKLDELGRTSVTDFKKLKKTPLIIILENIRSALNTGSVFRTCDAYAVEELILTGFTAQPPHKDILKTALGATQSVNWSYVQQISDVICNLKQQNYKVYAAEQTDSGILLPEFMPQPDEKIALIFGNEVNGVEDDTLKLCDGALELPQFGTKHSLNVSVCAGIFIYDISLKLRP